MDRFSGNELHGIFTVASSLLYKHEDYINSINYFPVPDKDTGSNLCKTFSSIYKVKKTNSFYNTLKSIASNIVMNARGNSGVIMCEYVLGMSNNAPQKDFIELNELSPLFLGGYNKANSLFETPKKGTIISAMKYVTFLFDFIIKSGVKTYEKLFKTIYYELFDHIEKDASYYTMTKNKKLKTIDSGAYGYLIFIKSFYEYYENPDIFNILSFQAKNASNFELDIDKKDYIKYETNYAIVCDSNCDLPSHILETNPIYILPSIITINGKEFYDKLDLSIEELYYQIKINNFDFNSSAPSIKSVISLFKFLSKNYDKIYVFSVSQKLSSTYNNLLNSIKTLDSKKFELFDTFTNSAASGLIIENFINNNLNINKSLDTNIFVILSTFKYASKSGRVPKVLGRPLMFLKVKPVMTISEGKGGVFSFSFTKKVIIKKIIRKIEEDKKTNDILSWAIVYTTKDKKFEYIKNKFTTVFGKNPNFICPTSQNIAMYSGPGSVAVAYTKRRKK